MIIYTNERLFQQAESLIRLVQFVDFGDSINKGLRLKIDAIAVFLQLALNRFCDLKKLVFFQIHS